MADPAAQTVQTPLERQVLRAEDGWAAAGTGTTGGSAAVDGNVYDVSTKAELQAAFAAAGSAPKIIRIHGIIDANTAPDGSLMNCENYADGTGYSLEQYLLDYDPATYGPAEEPAGAQETARRTAATRQAQNIRIDIPSNTTIVGATPESTITGAALRINGSGVQRLRNQVPGPRLRHEQRVRDGGKPGPVHQVRLPLRPVPAGVRRRRGQRAPWQAVAPQR